MATQAELDALEAALNSGVRTVTYTTPGGGTKSMTYHSPAELERRIARLKAELGQRTSTFADRGVSVSTSRDLE